MKNIKTLKMRNMRMLLVFFVIMQAFSSCSDYLDVVPDNTMEVEHMFQTREKAYGALSTCYSYLPFQENYNNDMILAGDEFLGRLDSDYDGVKTVYRGNKLMKGWQNANEPLLSLWDGRNGAPDLYEGIRMCNIFMENIELVPDINDSDRKDWIAQVNFLKAYFHFGLIKHYGPIIIADRNIEASEGEEAVAQKRQTVDSCFNYVVSLIDKSLPDLQNARAEKTYGQIDKTVALAVKAKVLLFAASPFYNGNSEFYSTFTNEEGVPYFNLDYKEEKWAKVLEAINAAIDHAEGVANRRLYEYEGQVRSWDEEDWAESEILKYVYNAKYTIYDQWNSELIWGYSNKDVWSTNTLQTICNMRSLEDPGISSTAKQNMSASYRMATLFHTKNGVPIDEDLVFDYEGRNSLTTIPDDDNYLKGVLQPLEKTVKLHMDREPRFYAWLGTDRGIWRVHENKNDLKMRLNEIPGGKAGTSSTDFFATGIAIKKLVHPQTRTKSGIGVVRYPRPLIRLADLYLIRAEAYNELHGPAQAVYDDLNKVRERVGLPKIEDVYSNGAIVRNVNKHNDKSGLRKIIHTERLIELCFEGHRYYDILRWKRASEFFTSPIFGWDVDKFNANEFYVLNAKQTREWITPRDYLFPISISELTLNINLKQNPGWGR